MMKVPASGGELTVLEKGGQLVTPVGIAVNGAGVVYVADAGAVFRVTLPGGIMR